MSKLSDAQRFSLIEQIARGKAQIMSVGLYQGYELKPKYCADPKKESLEGQVVFIPNGDTDDSN